MSTVKQLKNATLEVPSLRRWYKTRNFFYSFTKTIANQNSCFKNVIRSRKLNAYCHVPNYEGVKYYLEWSK